MNDSARSLSRKIEEHLPSRRGHGERVSSYSVATGYEIGLRNGDLVSLRWAALIHDAWKLNLPAEMLERPGPLTNEEMHIVREGPKRFFWEEADVFITEAVRQQYGSWTEICMGARIISVCAAFDVAAFGTPWKGALGEPDALMQIRMCSASQFDPVVVAAFLRIQPLIQPIFV